MTTDEKLNDERKQIQELGLKAVKSYFDCDISQFDAKLVAALHAKARLGMSFEREMNLNKRAIESNYLRAFRMVAEDKAELKKYIKKSLPHYLPA